MNRELDLQYDRLIVERMLLQHKFIKGDKEIIKEQKAEIERLKKLIEDNK